MFKYLRNIPILSSGSVTPANHRYVMQRYDEALIRLQYYYRRAVHSVANEHIVTQILRHAGVAYANDDALYYNSVRRQVNNIATSLKINTATQAPGALPRNSFYGAGVTEFLVAVDTPLPTGLSFKKYWWRAQPLRVRYHPYSDLSFNIPDGEDTQDVRGYAIIEINVPLLMLQFTHWKLWVQSRYETPPSIQQFVMQYPVLNMAESHYEVCWFNRLANSLDSVPNVKQKKHYGLALPDISNVVANDQEVVIERLQRGNYNVPHIGQLTPMAYSSSLWNFCLPPIQQYTRCNTVYYLMALLPYLAYMSKLSFQTNNKDNNELTLVFQEALRGWVSARWLNQKDVDVEALKTFVADHILRYLVI